MADVEMLTSRGTTVAGDGASVIRMHLSTGWLLLSATLRCSSPLQMPSDVDELPGDKTGLSDVVDIEEITLRPP
ncbi:MAG: hypothetical protein WA215_05365 [Candidatus Cybelea sp.]